MSRGARRAQHRAHCSHPDLPPSSSLAYSSSLPTTPVSADAPADSIISCCIILQNFSFSVVAAQLLFRRRRFNENRWLKLGWLGWVANIVTIVWTLFSTVMWLFPITPNPDGATMSECQRCKEVGRGQWFGGVQGERD